MDSDVVSILALGAIALYGLPTLLGRSLLARRQTGSTSWRGVTGRPGSVTWWAGVAVGLGFLGLVLAPLSTWAAPPSPVSLGTLGLGAALWLTGLAVTITAQVQMGDSWRIGVQAGERTELRTHGLFAWCRNPIFTGMLLAGLGMVLWVPLCGPAWLVLWLGLQLQVRLVEEPHLARVHGASYRAYVERTGRFLPRLF